MSNLEKLIEKAKRNPTDLRFDIVKRILNTYGYTNSHTKGSHAKFTKNNYPSLQIVKHHNKVKKWYIKKALHIIFSYHEEK